MLFRSLRLLKLIYSLDLIGLFASSNIQKSKLSIKNLSLKNRIGIAGGLGDSADKRGIFVILPNGQAVRNLDSWRIGRSKIEPGSTIIVPRDSTPFNAISIFRIFTPILANFATAAAAISALNN